MRLAFSFDPRRIGIVGGVGWRATVDYYSRFCEADEIEKRNGRDSPCHGREIMIDSLDLGHALALRGRPGDSTSWAEFDAYHKTALMRLEDAGVSCALIASNTAHERFEAITAGLSMPVIDLHSVIAKAVADGGFASALVLGAATTVASTRLFHAFEENGVAMVRPSDATQRALFEFIRRVQAGEATQVAAQLTMLARFAQAEGECDGPVCLACTDLPPVFPDRSVTPFFRHKNLVFLDTIQAHVRAALDLAY